MVCISYPSTYPNVRFKSLIAWGIGGVGGFIGAK